MLFYGKTNRTFAKVKHIELPRINKGFIFRLEQVNKNTKQQNRLKTKYKLI